MKSKFVLPITILIIGTTLLVGCLESETKYQCENGEVVDSIELCTEQKCPDCPEPTTETRYVCENGDIVNTSTECEQHSCPPCPEPEEEPELEEGPEPEEEAPPSQQEEGWE